MANQALTEEEKRYLVETQATPAAGLTADEAAYLNETPVLPKQPPEDPGLLRKAKHVVKGLGEGLVAEVLEAPYNIEQMADMGLKAIGVEGGLPGETSTRPWPQAVMGDEAYAKTREFLAGEEVTREESPWADRLRTAVEWGAAGPVNAARKGLRGAIPDIIQGVGAAAGEEIEARTSEDGEPSGYGELAGGLIGALAGSRTGISHVKHGQDEAYEFLTRHATNPRKAQATMREALARGDKGSLGDLTQDPKIYAMERGSARDSQFAMQLREVNARLQKQIGARVKQPFGAASAEDAAKAAEGSVAADLAQIDDTARLTKAKAAAEASDAAKAANEAALPLATTKRPAQTSTRLLDDITEGERAFKIELEDPAWDAWRASTDSIDVAPVYDKMDDYIAALDPAEKQAFLSRHGRLINESNAWGQTDEAAQIVGPAGAPMADAAPRTGSATPNDFGAWQSRLDDAIEKTRRPDGTYPRDGSLLIGVKKAAEEGMEKASKLFGEAKATTREKYARYKAGKVGDTRKTGGPETYVKRLNLKGESGAQVVRELHRAQEPQLIDDVAEHLKAEARVGDGVNQKFLAEYRDVIDALPGDKQGQFYNAATTEGLAQAKAKAAKDTAKAADIEAAGLTEYVRGSLVARYAAKPKSTIAAVLSDADGTRDIKALSEAMAAKGQGKSFKGAVRDYIDRKFLKSAADTDVARSADLREFRETTERLTDAGVLSKTEAENISIQMNRSRSLDKRREALQGIYMNVQGNEFEQLQASTLAALAMNALPGGGSQSLMMGGALRRWFRRMLTGIDVKPEGVEALERMLLNPEEYAKAIPKLQFGSPAEVLDHMFNNATKATRIGQTAEILGTTEEER